MACEILCVKVTDYLEEAMVAGWTERLLRRECEEG